MLNNNTLFSGFAGYTFSIPIDKSMRNIGAVDDKPVVVTGDKSYVFCSIQQIYPTVFDVTIPIDDAVHKLDLIKKGSPEYVEPSQRVQHIKNLHARNAINELLTDIWSRGFVTESYKLRDLPEYASYRAYSYVSTTGRQSHITAKMETGETVTYFLSWGLDGLVVQA